MKLTLKGALNLSLNFYPQTKALNIIFET